MPRRRFARARPSGPIDCVPAPEVGARRPPRRRAEHGCTTSPVASRHDEQTDRDHHQHGSQRNCPDQTAVGHLPSPSPLGGAARRQLTRRRPDALPRSTTFASSMALVIGPTPPGLGATKPATSKTSAATSPAILPSRLLTPDIENRGARLHHVGGDQSRHAGRGDNDVRLPHVAGEITGTGVAHGDRGVFTFAWSAAVRAASRRSARAPPPLRGHRRSVRRTDAATR